MAIQYPIALQKVSADGKYRLTVNYDDCAIHPLRTCDFPLHMDDWSRTYSARPYRHANDRSKDEHYESSERCMRMLLAYYGDAKQITERLIANGKESMHDRYDCALIYDKSRKTWLLSTWEPAYRSYTGERIEAHWSEMVELTCKREHIDLINQDLLSELTDECLADLIEHCLTDGVKVMSYGFGYQGSMSFYSNVCADSEGIAWLVKSEVVGDGKWLTEEQWRTKDCRELSRGETDEIEAWARGEVYWFEVEKNVKWKVHRECLSEERPDQDYEQEEWEQIDSCGGFYGLDYAVQYAIECNNLPPMIEAA